MVDITREALQEIARGINSSTIEELLEITDAITVMKLLERFGGDCLYFPKYSTVTAFRKRQQAVKDYFAGKPVKEIARLYGYSSRYVSEIVSKFQKDRGQANGIF